MVERLSISESKFKIRNVNSIRGFGVLGFWGDRKSVV